MWAWVLGYLVAGFGFVAKDQSEPVYNQPGYLRSNKGRWIVRLLWPVVSLRLFFLHLSRSSPKLKHKYIGGQFLPTWFLFVAIGAIGMMVGNWLFD
jgi:hypothetical protein